MKSFKMFVNALVMPVLLFAPPLALCGEGDIYQEAREVARKEVWEYINAGKVCCASVAVLVDGGIVYSEGFGMADRESSLPVNAGTLFNMGSNSKIFCAAAIMLLVDEGKVELDAPVTRYLSEFTMADPRYRDITVRMLLNHASGMPSVAVANNFGYDFNSTVYEDTLENLARSHLKAAPGEAAPYCNDGFTLAEMIVARVSGRDYIDFLQERVFTPLSLTRTGRSVGQRDDPDIGGYYQPDGRKVPFEVISILGAGGLSATAEDLAVFADSLSAGGRAVLSVGSIAEMIKAQPSFFAQSVMEETGINPEDPFGLGLDFTDFQSYKEQGIKVIGKGGITDQYKSCLLSVPEERISVAVMAAGTDISFQSKALHILKSVLEARGLIKAEKASPPSPPVRKAIPAKYRAFSGFYAGAGLYKVEFDSTWTATMTTIEVGEEDDPSLLTYRDGHFETEDGQSLWFISAAGHDFIWNGVTVYGDRLSTSGWSPQTLGRDIDDMVWLRRNFKPFEKIAVIGAHITMSTAPPGLDGYIDFLGVKRVESPDFAGMVSSLITEQHELILIDRGGKIWAQVSDYLFSAFDETAAPLGIGNTTVTIGEEGYSEWLQAGEQLVLTVDKPANGRVIVISSDPVTIQDSVMDTGEFTVSEDGFVEVAGSPGDTFKLTAAAPPAPWYAVLDSGDYNGDGLSEIAVFRPDTGLWAVREVTRAYFGSAVDTPASGDYDGDGVTDVAVFRAVTGLWAVRGVTRLYFGSAVDRPVPGDYNGDGTCDPAVLGTTSRWSVRGLTRAYFGGSGDLPVPGDYDGDGVKEIAVFRSSTGLWAVRGVTRAYFGKVGDRPVAAVYSPGSPLQTGIAVFRPSSGLWAVRGYSRCYFGRSGDIPAPGDFTGDSLDGIGVFRGTSGLWAIKGVTRAYFGTGSDLPVTR